MRKKDYVNIYQIQIFGTRSVPPPRRVSKKNNMRTNNKRKTWDRDPSHGTSLPSPRPVCPSQGQQTERQSTPPHPSIPRGGSALYAHRLSARLPYPAPPIFPTEQFRWGFEIFKKSKEIICGNQLDGFIPEGGGVQGLFSSFGLDK